MTAQHLCIVGARRSDRLACARTLSDGELVVARCHQRLRGPYTGVDTALSAVLPEAQRRWPYLVEHHRVELLHGMPDLEAIIGSPPRTLAAASPLAERSRWFDRQLVRCMNQGIVTFLRCWATEKRILDERVPALFFDEAHAAEVTTQEVLALLLRRVPADRIAIVVGTDGGPLTAELTATLTQHARRVEVPSRPCGDDRRDVARLAADYVASDGTSDDPAELDAYRRADPELVRALHDRRADELEPKASTGTRIGAIAYHREHGSDPRGAGLRALTEAVDHCRVVGLSQAVVDLCARGCAVADPVADEDRYIHFVHSGAGAVGSLGRFDESYALLREMRQRSTSPKAHMRASYAIAMLHTRFFQPRDHDMALQWQNNAVALARVLPDPADRAIFGVFHDNALALIEMHRGNLSRALDLVEGAMARFDEQVEPGRFVLHRSVLQYNRARLLLALGRLDEAVDDLSALIDLDPYYTDYLTERARASRARGDLAAALADYDRAVELAPPFPELYYNRGTGRVEMGDLKGAMADFDYVLDMEPGDLPTRIARAELHLSAGELDAAQADVDAGLAQAPDDLQLRCLLGTLHLERRAWQSAVEALDAVLAADPQYLAALLNRAVARHELGHHAGAVDDLNAILAVVGDHPDVLLNRGIAHEAAGRLDEALADYDHALRLPGANVEELTRRRMACSPLRAPA